MAASLSVSGPLLWTEEAKYTNPDRMSKLFIVDGKN
jgi:hypothetical protein